MLDGFFIEIVINFFTQGYLFTAFVLFLLFLFHDRYRNYYNNLAKTANRVIGLFLFIVVVAGLATAQMVIITFGFKSFNYSDPFDWLLLLFDPFIIVFIALLFPAIRHYRVWILIPAALLLNIPVLSNLSYTHIAGYGVFFTVLIIFIEAFTQGLKHQVKKADDKLPERI